MAPGGGEAAAAHLLLDSSRDLTRRDLVDRLGHHPERDAGAGQGAEQHVAAGSRGRVDPGDHGRPPEPGHRRPSRVCVAGHPRGEDAGAVAVVDVHDRDPGSARVEHRQQRGQAAEGGAVPDAGGHRHEGYAAQAADDAGQRALHAGDHDEAVGAGEARRGPRAAGAARRPRRPRSAAPPAPCTAAVERRLGGHRGVRGAGGDHRDQPARRRERAQRDRPRDLVDDGLGQLVAHERPPPRRRAGWPAPRVGMLVVQRAQDPDDLGRGSCRLAVDDLRVPGARGTVDVDAGVPEVGGPCFTGALEGGFGHGLKLSGPLPTYAGPHSGTLPVASPSRYGVVTPSYIRCVTIPSPGVLEVVAVVHPDAGVVGDERDVVGLAVLDLEGVEPPGLPLALTCRRGRARRRGGRAGAWDGPRRCGWRCASGRRRPRSPSCIGMSG